MSVGTVCSNFFFNKKTGFRGIPLFLKYFSYKHTIEGWFSTTNFCLLNSGPKLTNLPRNSKINISKQSSVKVKRRWTRSVKGVVNFGQLCKINQRAIWWTPWVQNFDPIGIRFGTYFFTFKIIGNQGRRRLWRTFGERRRISRESRDSCWYFQSYTISRCFLHCQWFFCERKDHHILKWEIISIWVFIFKRCQNMESAGKCTSFYMKISTFIK